MPATVPPRRSQKESSTSIACQAASNAWIAASPSRWSWIMRTRTTRFATSPRWLAILWPAPDSKATASRFSDLAGHPLRLNGRCAGRRSAFVGLTSDNPRSEDPLAIMNDAVVGLQRSGAKYAMEPDRRKAIALALHHATPGDIVLLAGKGHEKVQATKEGTIPFDDVDVAREKLMAVGYDCKTVAKAGTAGKTA